MLIFRSFFVRAGRAAGIALLAGLCLLAGDGLSSGAGAAPAAVPGLPERLVGQPRVLDADTLQLGGHRLRLYGIDAPEDSQRCIRPDGRAWDCGAWATRELRRMIRNRDIACTPLRRDVFGRVVARCSLEGADLNAEIVAQGLAMAFRRYSQAYVAQEAAARTARRGIWQGEVEPPWEFRARTRNGRTGRLEPPDPDCAIKGNVSANGRIYHIPGSAHYGRTRIDTARGQRWFCSVEEAEQAGWRAPRG